MGVRLAFRFGLTVTLPILILLLLAQGLGPLLPGAGQLSFETPAAYYMLDVARRIQYPIIQDASGLHSWSADGRRLAYSRPVNSTDSELMLMELFGPEAPIYPASILQPPLWSPDNQAMAFVNADQSNLVMIEPAAHPAAATHLAHSMPDNARLQWDDSGRLRFVVPGKSDVRLYEIDPDTLEPWLMRIWSVDFFQSRPPVFASDGSRFIIPAIQANALNLELYLFDVESDTVENISNRPLFNDSSPVWSPDGTAMVYQSANDAGQFLILDSGAEPTILLHVQSGFIRGITWSPDQASLSFFLSQSGQQAICILTLASQTLDCPVQDADAMIWRPAS